MKIGLGEVRINLDVLVQEDLTPSEYIFLYFLHNNNIQNAYTISGLSKQNVYILEEREFVKCTNPTRLQEYNDKTIVMDEPDVVLDSRGLGLFEVQDADKNFQEFWNTFPQKVPDGHGSFRVLRSIKLGTHDAEVCKKKYLKLIKSDPLMHSKIISGLKNQLVIERHRLQYINNPETWLNQKIYEKYQEPPQSTKPRINRI